MTHLSELISLFQLAKSSIETNSLLYLFAIFGTALLLTLFLKIIMGIIGRALRRVSEKTLSKWDDIAVDLIDGLKSGVIFSWILYLLFRSTTPSGFTDKILFLIVVVVSTYQIAIWGLHVIRNWQASILNKKLQEDPSSAAALGLLSTVVQALFVVSVVLIGISQLGIDIGALLAGLGVGGIAVALAAQNVLADLLASLSIVLDKPFVLGDFIVAGNEMGNVEHIGIKTTRIRSLSGEQLILSNKDLLESRIRNFKRMQRRRVVLRFGVVYSTPANMLEQIPAWVKMVLEEHKELEFDRCHFADCGSYSLDFELVFYVLSPDYNVFMDYKQKILLSIVRQFEQKGVEFAFPTQSLYIENMRKRN